jgi:hypothetical protein
VRAGRPWALVALLAVTAVGAGCSSGGAIADTAGCPGKVLAPVSGPRPSAAAAQRAAYTYMRALTTGRPASGMEQPVDGAGRCSLAQMRSWLAGIPIARAHITSVWIGNSVAGTAAVLVSITARLGRPPGTIWISLGQRALAVSGGARPKIVADISHMEDTASDGLAAIPRATYAVGRSGVVVSDGAPGRDVHLALAAVDQAYPMLTRRYASTRLEDPIVIIVPNRQTGQDIAGYPISTWEAGSELGGLILLMQPDWCCGQTFKQGIVVHELTHAATRALDPGTPISLIEGFARYEEQLWDAAHGYVYPTQDLAAAYERGWRAAGAWQWPFSTWYDVSSKQLAVRYQDGAAVVREVVREAGLRGLRKLAATLRADGGQAWFPPRRLNAAFRSAIGVSFDEIEQRARAATIAAN